jgi:hypothetical protein
MQLVLDQDEAWALMTLIASYVIDKSGVSQAGKQAIRKWRTDRAEGTALMEALAVDVNEALGTYLEEKTTRRVKRKGRYVMSKDLKR